MTNTGLVLADVGAERERQVRLRDAGRFRYTLADAGMSDMERLAALMEEVGEAARALLERNGAVNDKHGGELRKELVQIAAVCVAWVERIDADRMGGGRC